jgi:hypothetical protein
VFSAEWSPFIFRKPPCYSNTAPSTVITFRIPAVGHELTGIRRGIAMAGRFDRPVHGQDDRGVAGGPANHAWRLTILFGPADPTTLIIHAVLSPALRQTEGLIGSIITLHRLALTVPDHSTMCRRSRTSVLSDPEPARSISSSGEWLIEKHRTFRRRCWRELNIGIDAGSGEILAIELKRHR